jgi:hypothetical protein
VHVNVNLPVRLTQLAYLAEISDFRAKHCWLVAKRGFGAVYLAQTGYFDMP